MGERHPGRSPPCGSVVDPSAHSKSDSGADFEKPTDHRHDSSRCRGPIRHSTHMSGNETPASVTRIRSWQAARMAILRPSEMLVPGAESARTVGSARSEHGQGASVEPPSTTIISSGEWVCRRSESSKAWMDAASFLTVAMTLTGRAWSVREALYKLASSDGDRLAGRSRRGHRGAQAEQPASRRCLLRQELSRPSRACQKGPSSVCDEPFTGSSLHPAGAEYLEMKSYWSQRRPPWQ